jgi:hypothetical protein
MKPFVTGLASAILVAIVGWLADPKWYRSPEWWLVIMGIPTLLFIGWQAYATQRAAEATRESAKASLMNVQALIKSERPWFIATFEPSAEDSTVYRLRIMNKGNTPGILEEMFAETTFAERPDTLPVPPTFSNPCIAPNDSLFSRNDFYVVPYDYKPSMMLSQHLSNANHRPTDLLVVYGKLTYADIFPENDSGRIVHETRWCFFWFEKERRRVRCGPREYSGHRDYEGESV